MARPPAIRVFAITVAQTSPCRTSDAVKCARRVTLSRNALANRCPRPALRQSLPARLAARMKAPELSPVPSQILIEEFVEIDFGAFEGLTADEIRERYPADYAHWKRHRLDPDYAYPQGESRAAFLDRVHRGVARMLTIIDPAHHDRGGNAIVVAHRGVIRAITERLAEVAPIMELASIHSLVREPGKLFGAPNSSTRPIILPALSKLNFVFSQAILGFAFSDASRRAVSSATVVKLIPSSANGRETPLLRRRYLRSHRSRDAIACRTARDPRTASATQTSV